MESIRQSYKKLPVTVKATFWFIACSFLQKAIFSLTTPIFTRLMSTAEYGEYAVYTTTLNLLMIVVTLNVNETVAMKGINKFPEQKAEFLLTALLISSCSTVFFVILYLAASNFWNGIFGLSTSVMLLMMAQMFFQPAFGLWAAKEKYEYKYKGIVLFTILSTCCSTVTGIAAVLYGRQKGYARIYTSAVTQIVFCLVLYFLLFIKGKKFNNPVYWKFTLKFNIPLIPHGLSNQILSRSDIFMIQYFCGMADAGIYSLGYSVGMLLTVLTTSVNNSFVPWLYECLDRKEYDSVRKNTGLILTGIFILVSVMIMVSPELIVIFATEEYKAACYVIQPVFTGIYFTLIYSLFVNIELYLEKTGLVMTGSIFVAFLNVTLNWFCIPRFGYLAAAYTTLLSYFLYSVIHYIGAYSVCRGKIELKELYQIKEIMLLAFLQLLMMFLGISLVPRILVRYSIAAVLMLAGLIFVRKYDNRKKGEIS